MPSKVGAQKNEWLTYLAECAKHYHAGHRLSPHVKPKASTEHKVGAHAKSYHAGASTEHKAGAHAKSKPMQEKDVQKMNQDLKNHPKAKAKPSKPLQDKDVKKLNQDVKKEGKRKAKEAQAKEAGKAK